MNDKHRRRLVLILALALVALGGVQLLHRPATHHPGGHFNQGTNAAWLGVDWVNAPHTDAEIAALADDLATRQITTVYVFTSYLKENGEFNPTYAHAADFGAALHRAAPGIDVQAWLGLPLTYVDLGDEDVRGTIAHFSATLVDEHGFDGVHLDPEPIHNDDAHVLQLLEDVRAALGADPTFSIATRRLWPLTPERERWVPGRWCWSAPYYREVAARVDEIAVMVYDSALPLAPAYRLWTKAQVITLSRTLEEADVGLFIGVPTSEERTPTHRPAAENVGSGVRGVVDWLNDARAVPHTVTGVALYPYWETDAAEWRTYAQLWLNEAPDVRP